MDSGSGRFALLVLLLMLGFGAPVRGVDEVWLGSNDGANARQFDYSGNSLGTLSNATRYVGTMTVVGNAVWFASNDGANARRFDFDGDQIDTLSNATRYVGTMAVVGSTVWFGSNDGANARRFDFNGTQIDTLSNATRYVGTMAAVGNTVWFGSNDGANARRFDFNGTQIDTLSSATRYLLVMNVVDNAVWFVSNDGGNARRFDFNGNQIDTLSSATRYVTAMAVLQSSDCNSNGVSDFDDINGVTSEDCNTNIIPDECDIANSSSDDCNTDGIPDECQTDCNNNDVPDNCDLLSGFSEDCNTNAVPDECDIAGPTSVDCNANQVPDECDIATGFSEDCNNNGLADECEANSGDKQWVGGDGDAFGDGAKWSPSGAPGDAGNAMIANAGALDNRCVLADGGPTTVCSVSISASGSGRQYLQIDEFAVLVTNDLATIDVGGSLDLRGGEIIGGPVYNNSNTITGYGYVSSNTYNQGLIVPMIGERLRFTGPAFENQSGGTLRAGTLSLTHVMSSGVSQEGSLEVQSLGAIVFDQPLLNAVGGSISLLNGTLVSGGLTNADGAMLSGFGVIQSGFANHGDVNIIADMQVLGDLDNEGTIVVQSGLLTITGNLTGGGSIIGGFGGRGGDGGFHVSGDFSLGAGARFSMDGGRLSVEGDVDIAIADDAALNLRTAEIDMVEGGRRGVRTIEVLAQDVGPRSDALSEPGLFPIDTLRIGPATAGVRLVNHHANGVARREALYVRHLVLEPGAQLDLGGLSVYYGHLSCPLIHGKRAESTVIDSHGGGGLYEIPGRPG